MRPTRALSWSSSLPVLASVALLTLPAALFIGACGGTTEDDFGAAAGSGGSGGAAAGSAGAPAAGSAGSAGQPKAGSGGSAGSTAGSGGSSAGSAGSAGQGEGGGSAGGSTAGSAGQPQGGSSQGGSAGSTSTNTCATCINTDCKEQVDKCNADPECAETGQCVLDNCLESSSINEVISCAISQCNANLQNPNPNLLPIAQCAQKSCGGDCAFSQGQGGSGGSGGAGGSGGDPGAAPGKINCGSATCDQASEGDCCITVADFSGPQYSCKPKDQCKGGFISINQPCDGPEDCNGGMVCCGKFSQGGGGIACSTTCESSGGGQQGAFELCHKDDDCDKPATCQTCDVGQFGISFVVRICGEQCPGQGPGGPGGPLPTAWVSCRPRFGRGRA